MREAPSSTVPPYRFARAPSVVGEGSAIPGEGAGLLLRFLFVVGASGVTRVARVVHLDDLLGEVEILPGVRRRLLVEDDLVAVLLGEATDEADHFLDDRARELVLLLLELFVV